MKDLQKDEPGFLASTFSPFYPRLLGIFLKVVKKKKNHHLPSQQVHFSDA